MPVAVETKISVGVGLASLAGLGLLWKLWKTDKPPTRWRKVGELCELICFPIKSAGAVRLDEMECSIIGVQNGYLRDRIFMCVTLENQFISGRTHPKLMLIQPRYEGNTLILTAPNMPDMEVDMVELAKRPWTKTMIWGQTVKSIDCGEELAVWLSTLLLGEECGVRMMYYPLKISERNVRPKNLIWKKVEKKDCGALHDVSSYMLMCETSVEDLNSRLTCAPMTAQQFRPNFVVRGTQPFDEDNWEWVRIGGATFRNIRPCARCILTTVDPATGVKDKTHEPLLTLRKYRLLPEVSDRDPVMGIHLGLRIPGRLKIGDAVYVQD